MSELAAQRLREAPASKGGSAISDVRDRIVVAVAPGTSAEAVDLAFALAAERGVPLLAVRAWHDSEPAARRLAPTRAHRPLGRHPRKARRELDLALERARAAHPTVELSTLVVDDEPVPFLTALSSRAGVLVLGRTRRRGQEASPADALVRQAACPVLVVPPTRRTPSAPVRVLAASGD